MPRRVVLAAIVMAVVFLAIYLPDIGHGFISDDYRWIAESRVDEAGDVARLFRTNVGFYRPLVSLAFAADHAVWGTRAFGYGLTNLLLLGIAAVLLYELARRFDLPPAASLVAVGVWLFNFHAVNMALLWISGRTALLASVWALATAILFLRGRFAPAAMSCLAAMLSKEEAVALPVLCTVYAWSSGPRAHVLRSTGAMWGALAIYLVLRVASGAFWPTDAPPFYALTLSPSVIARNVLEYADRAGTVAAGAGLLLFGLCRVRRVGFAEAERRTLLFSALWIPAMFALTVLVPVRSSLYALLPSVGSALAAGAVASAALRARPVIFTRVVTALLVGAVLLVPVYRSRNGRWVELAELSERVMSTLQRETAGRSGGHLVLIDAIGERFNLDAAFGALFPDAVRLRLGNGWTGEIAARDEEPKRRADFIFQLSKGALVRGASP
jgi:hypothetical protein